jgi:regulator of sigma E protease
VQRGLDATWFVVTESSRQLARTFTDEQAREQIQSVVGVGAVYNEIADEGISTVLRFMGVLSLALAIFNLIPIPPLDGGHILFAIIEKLKGSPIPRAVYERASLVGMALMLLLFVFVLQNDIININNGTVLGPR